MADHRTVYLDHAATSPMRPEVAEAMAAVGAEGLGNPSGAHRLARAARRRLDEAREEVAALLGRHPGEVVFTSGGTEGDNLAILGSVSAHPHHDAAAICSAVEHHAVLDAVGATGGVTVAVDARGRVDLADLGRRLDELGDRVAVVSVMAANNETGVINDLAAVAGIVGDRAPLHTDAVAGARWLDLSTTAAPAALVTITAHKLGGPVGIGVLVVADGTPLAARQIGGGQERGRRSGTVDVTGAVGLAAALRLAVAERETAVTAIGARRDRLADGLRASVSGLVETAGADGDRSAIVAGTCHVCIPGIDAEALLFLLDEAGVCASAASSCASGAQQASHVLAAMGVDAELARGSLRLTLGPSTTDADVEAAIAAVVAAVDRLRTSAGVPVP